MNETIVSWNRKYAGRSKGTRARFGVRMPRRRLAHVLNHGGALICILVMIVSGDSHAQDGVFSVFKLGEFKYANQTVAMLPYTCSERALCDEVRDVLDDLMFDQFGDKFIEERKVKKALKQARLKELDAENMPAIANHLKADIFVKVNLEIEKLSAPAKAPRGVDADYPVDYNPSSLLQVELVLFNPRDGAEILKVQSVGKGGTDTVRKRFELLFLQAFESD